ncbi:MAG: DUF1827 family protein [Streptococcaceae bacterium]|jgi:hypothetical protein|nr:DUF1827 family protein [Streptococcaceae bacterium]
MKLINVTNTHSQLVRGQLDNTDAELVEVYTTGSTTIIYTKAPHHHEVVITNKNRKLRLDELRAIKHFFFKKLNLLGTSQNVARQIDTPNLVEISIPIKKPEE